MTSPNRVRVHLYTAVLDGIDGARARARCEALLNADERERMGRLRLEHNRCEFLFSHALLRLALSRHRPDTAPEAWRFSTGPQGRPAVAGPGSPSALHFNLSHTSGLVACAVATEEQIGVDVEATDRGGSTGEIAARSFAAAEVEALGALAPADQVEGFFRFWTLKESYIKARGLGLALPLDQFWFVLSSPEAAAIQFGPSISDRPARWRFAERRPTPRHRLALALGSDRPGNWTLEVVQEGLHHLADWLPPEAP